MGTSKSAEVNTAQAVHTPIVLRHKAKLSTWFGYADEKEPFIRIYINDYRRKEPSARKMQFADNLVRAVNSHAELVEACKAAKQWLIADFSTLANPSGELSRVPVFEQLCKAIHKAEVQS